MLIGKIHSCLNWVPYKDGQFVEVKINWISSMVDIFM